MTPEDARPLAINITATLRTALPPEAPWSIIEYDYWVVVQDGETGEELVRGKMVRSNFINDHPPRMPEGLQ